MNMFDSTSVNISSGTIAYPIFSSSGFYDGIGYTNVSQPQLLPNTSIGLVSRIEIKKERSKILNLIK